jgi:hypothetical protein
VRRQSAILLMQISGLRALQPSPGRTAEGGAMPIRLSPKLLRSTHCLSDLRNRLPIDREYVCADQWLRTADFASRANGIDSPRVARQYPRLWGPSGVTTRAVE